VIGGVLVTANLFGASWRPVFLVNVPIGLAVLALVPRVVPRDTPGRGRRLDLAGLGIAVPAVFLVVLPLMLGHQEGWPGWVLACIALGLLLAVVFVLVERRITGRGGDPLLNLEVLRAPGLVPGLVAVAVLMITYGGFLFSFALHLQAGLGDSALRAGLTFAPCALVFGFCGYFWRRLPASVHHLLAPLGCGVAVFGYLAVALSQSGATPEVVETAASMRRAGAVVIGIANEPGSPLTQVCDLSLLTEAGPELAVPATKTVTAQMLAVAAIAAAFDSDLVAAADLAALPGAVASLLADSGASGGSRHADTLAERWADARRLVVTGRGLAYAAALETALKIKETAQVHAEVQDGKMSAGEISP